MKTQLKRGCQIVGCAAALTIGIAPALHAQGSNEYTKLTYLTFSAPVEVPGASLPAGRYMFKMADILTGSAHAVQVFSEDGKKIYTTFLAVPDQRPESPKETVIMFAERAAGAPQAVKEWFYPGNPTGEEFVYPRSQAVKIAQANHTPVLATGDGTAGSGSKVFRVDETGNDASTKTAAVTTAPEAQVARAQEAPAPVAAPRQNTVGTSGQAPAPAARARTLPRTASNLGLFELLSALSFAGAFGARQLRLRGSAVR